jgi:hypothetical protein
MMLSSMLLAKLVGWSNTEHSLHTMYIISFVVWAQHIHSCCAQITGHPVIIQSCSAHLQKHTTTKARAHADPKPLSCTYKPYMPLAHNKQLLNPQIHSHTLFRIPTCAALTRPRHTAAVAVLLLHWYSSKVGTMQACRPHAHAQH